MDKLKMHTPDLAEENFRKLAALFPNAVTETKKEDGEVVRAIDADALRQEISAAVVEGAQERYQFTWPDKRRSVVLANQPIAKTLRPCAEESSGRDGTPGRFDSENLYIEGDNLDALKLLRETYLGKIKMIYIDPPYNTGSDFIYRDDFSAKTGEYLSGSGQYDDEGNQLVQNTESNGRFHTDWLNMLYPRLRLAKDLLTDDGVIFISIDDNEQENLKKICNEVFGERNFACLICVKMSHLSGMKMSHKDKKIPKIKEFVYMYSKSIRNLRINPVYVTGEWDNVLDRYTGYIENFEQDISKWHRVALNSKIDGLSANDALQFKIKNASRIFRTAVNDTFSKYPKDNKFHHFATATGLTKIFYNSEEVIFADSKIQLIDGKYQPADTIGDIWTDIGINNLHKEGYVAFPNGKKPLKLIDRLLRLSTSSNDFVLDFFSGSATTAHAVMQLNAEDGGRRKFIMVQLPEPCAEGTEAAKAGYKNICEIGKERIRRAAKKIREETQAEIDCGFRVFQVDSSNLKDVYYRPADCVQEQMELFADNLKADRTPEDLLFQVMLDLGMPLSAQIEESAIAGKKVFSVSDGYLIACFDSAVTGEVVKEIAERRPCYAVFRDSGMASDSVLANFEQIFEAVSPGTHRKVL